MNHPEMLRLISSKHQDSIIYNTPSDTRHPSIETVAVGVYIRQQSSYVGKLQHLYGKSSYPCQNVGDNA